MCGIVGIVDFETPIDSRRVTRMGRIIRHRGPDGEGTWHGREVSLGCRRLAIVDVANGTQPTCNEAETVHVVFNGEIYNHRDLRSKLRSRGHWFRSDSDVEVISHLYEENGPGFVSALDGDFAIALWDSEADRLVLARDRVGVKPLFYHANRQHLIFGSEIKAVLASGYCDIAVDPQGISDCFYYGHPIAPSTFWSGVTDLEPGTVVCFDRAGLRRQRYFTPLLRPDPTRPLLRGDDAVDSFSSLFTQAVRKRLPSEVRGGVSLSGGIDSTSIAAVASRVCDSPLPTCSIRLIGEELDESHWSRYVADELHLDHQEVIITGKKACELLPRSIWHFESPFWFGAVATPFYEMTRLAQSQGFKVALSGDGSDEMLAGYDFYRLMKFGHLLAASRQTWLAPALWRQVVKWTTAPTGVDQHIRRVHADLKHYESQFGEVPAWIYLWSAIDQASRPLLNGNGLPPPSRLPPPPPSRDRLRRQLHFEFASRLPNWILVISDRLGMANGLEVRVPFLDRDLIDLCSELSPDMIMKRSVEKYVLRRAMSRLAPARVVRRRKRPFLTPIARWYLGGPGRDLAGQYLSEAAVRRFGIFRPVETERLWLKATEATRHWDTVVAEWVCLMVLSTHILVEQFRPGHLLDDPV